MYIILYACMIRNSAIRHTQKAGRDCVEDLKPWGQAYNPLKPFNSLVPPSLLIASDDRKVNDVYSKSNGRGIYAKADIYTNRQWTYN